MLFPATDLINFSIVFVLGFLSRTKPLAHKLLMLLAGILILDPAFARMISTIGAPFPFVPLLDWVFLAY